MTVAPAVHYAASAAIPPDVVPPRKLEHGVPVSLRGLGGQEGIALEITDDGAYVALQKLLPTDVMVEAVFTERGTGRRLRVYGEVVRSAFLIGRGGQAMPAAVISFFGLDEDGRTLLRDFVSAHFLPAERI